MYINYLDLFSAKLTGKNEATFAFMQSEFSGYISDHHKNDLKIHIHFEDDIMQTDEYIVREPVSYDERGVYIFDKNKRKARIDFGSLGQGLCSISCDPNFHTSFFAILFEFIAYVEALRLNHYFCHSSAFIYNGKSILCPAWRNVGKTNLLLQFMLSGSDYLADDWCLINNTGRAYMLPKRLHLFDYNFLSFPEIAAMIDPTLEPLLELYQRITDGEFNVPEKARSEIEMELKRRVKPEDLFPKQIARETSQIDYVFYITRNVKDPESGVYLNTLSDNELIKKITEVLRYEQKPFRQAYAVYKARTGKRNPLLENDLEHVAKIAKMGFANSQIYEVLTPSQDHSEEVQKAITEVVRGGCHVN